MNPCPCGYFNDLKKKCICQPTQISRYLKKISGPILDRIDIIIDVPRLKTEDFTSTIQNQNYTSASMKENVIRCRNIQLKRQKALNGKLSNKALSEHILLSQECTTILEKAIEKGTLTGRSYNKVLKVARTIADLENEEHINTKHICEAIQYRNQSALLN